MKFQLTIDCDNAAFEGEKLGPELARILEGTARVVQSWDADYVITGQSALTDYNGNKVGTAGLTGD